MNVPRRLLGLVVILALVQSARAAKPGATLPWVTYEAEQMTTSGTVLGPDYTGHTPAREASGRQCVRLSETSQYVQFTARAQAQGLVVRYCIPNTPDGRGADATLSLYINGQLRTKLPMTSRFSYLYGAYPFSNDPSAGTPRHFWDEVRIMPGAIQAGDVIRLEKDAGDTAKEYLIDLVDLETVPPPLERPTGSISVIELGANPNGQSDARPAFEAAIADAITHHKTVWIPPGQFVVKGPLEVNDVTIRGAGMWYSMLIGADKYAPGERVAIEGNGSNIILSDFAIVGKLHYRNDTEGNDGLGGSFGTGSSIHNIWVEHTKTGAWLVNSDGLVVDGCRFRNTIADGLNLCVGMRDTVVRNCSARGTGDDCFAVWPATYKKAIYQPGHNRLVNCTAQLPFLAQGFAIYGGDANSVENCAAIDIPYGAGIFASTTFPTEFGFRGVTNYRRIQVTRCGDRDGAVGIFANLVDLAGLRFEDIDVVDSPADGIRFTSIHNHVVGDTTFDQIRIVNPGLAGAGSGIVAAKGAVGSATISNVTVLNPRTASFQNNDPAFNLIRREEQSNADDSTAGGAPWGP